MSKISSFIVICVLVFTSTHAARCTTHDSNLTGKMNLNPIDNSKPILLSRIQYGELYSVGTPMVDQIHVLHLYGSGEKRAYNWGFATGTLLKEEINQTLNSAWSYFEMEIIAAINGTATKLKIPPQIVQLIAELGLEAVLDLQNDESKQFIDPEIYDEMQGMADASSVSFTMIRRIHFIGEITRGSCSLYGAWGKATLGGKTLQLRALDWDTGAMLQNHPLVTVYHIEDGSGYSFANVGWAGWIGLLTGMSSNKMGMSEIGVSYPDFPPYFGTETFIGIPFVFLERWIMQHTQTVADAIEYVTNANRTCDLMFGVADAKSSTAVVMQYSGSIVRFFNDTDLEPLADWHPRLENVVYEGMDWNCPGYQKALYTQLALNHGSLTPELSILNVTSQVGTGDLHVAVYDLSGGMMYVANARGDGMDGPKDAYDRQFVSFNISALFVKLYGE